MTHWTARAGLLLRRASREVRRAGRSIGTVLGNDPYELLAYYGYGNARRAYVHGRALEVRKVSASADTDSMFRNLLNTYRRAEADPLPFALRIQAATPSTGKSKAPRRRSFWYDARQPLVGGN